MRAARAASHAVRMALARSIVLPLTQVAVRPRAASVSAG